MAWWRSMVLSVPGLPSMLPGARSAPDGVAPAQTAATVAGPRGSLAGRTLLLMTAMIATIIVVTTAIGYLHTMRAFEALEVEELGKYVHERSEREREVFTLAADDLDVLKLAFQARLSQQPLGDPTAEFDGRFVRYDDGVIRNRPETFDGTRQPGVYIGKDATVDADLKDRVLVAYDLVSAFGPAWHNRFQDTYVSMPEHVSVLWWPDVPTWVQDATADLNLPDQPYLQIAEPGHNPDRQTAWTDLHYDRVSGSWLVTAAAPVDLGDRHVATVHLDLQLTDLLDRTVNDHIDGSYNIVFNPDGRLIAHPALVSEIEAEPDTFDSLRDGDAHTRRIYDLIRSSAGRQLVLDNGADDEYLGVTRIEEPGWYFVTVYPRTTLEASAYDIAGVILALGVLSLVVEAVVLYVVLGRQIAAPLTALIRGTERVAAGDLDIQLDEQRPDELGRLARSFNAMAREIRGREQRLQQEVRELRITIDDTRKNRQVAEITETDYFQRLRQRVIDLRGRGKTPTSS